MNSTMIPKCAVHLALGGKGGGGGGEGMSLGSSTSSPADVSGGGSGEGNVTGKLSVISYGRFWRTCTRMFVLFEAVVRLRCSGSVRWQPRIKVVCSMITYKQRKNFVFWYTSHSGTIQVRR